jgi:hypothetical protein
MAHWLHCKEMVGDVLSTDAIPSPLTHRYPRSFAMISLSTILLIILILILLGAIPAWPHSRNWGYGPSGGLGLIVVILLILVLMGKI